MKRKNLFIYAIVCIVAIGIAIGCTTTLEKRDCVVMIGDSIFALSGAITRNLEEISGQEYRQYYMSGAQLSGGINDIESQYDSAARAGAIRTVIMNGGGNDSLIGNADGEELAEEIRAAYGRILDKAQRDGVENMVVLGYYVTSTDPGDMAQGMALLGAALEAGGAARGINLVFVDPNKDEYFSSRRPSQYTVDGIHPDSAAAERLAQLIWNAMIAKNIEQGAGCSSSSSSSGGCN